MAPAYLHAALLFGLATAQTSYLDFTLSTKNTGDCGRSDGNDASTIRFSLTQIPGEPTCFNLNSTIADDSVIAATTTNFNSTASYSQIYYYHPDDQNSTSSNIVADVELVIYNGRDCVQANGTDGEIEPYYRWNCFDASRDCENLNYGVGSFAINPVNESRRSGRCVEAEDDGSAGVVLSVGWTLGLSALVASLAFTMS